MDKQQPQQHVPSIVVQTTLQQERTTKGTVVYANKMDGAAISTLYISKSQLSQPYPERIMVTVTDTTKGG